MCQISKLTVIRANERMIKGDYKHSNNTQAGDWLCVSVYANGRLYKQELTRTQIHEAFGKAIINTNSNV